MWYTGAWQLTHTQLLKIKAFFGFDNLKQFRDEWNRLTAKDKEDIRSGIASGSLTY